MRDLAVPVEQLFRAYSGARGGLGQASQFPLPYRGPHGLGEELCPAYRQCPGSGLSDQQREQDREQRDPPQVRVTGADFLQLLLVLPDPLVAVGLGYPESRNMLQKPDKHHAQPKWLC